MLSCSRDADAISIASLTANAAPRAAVPRRLCPQPWPGPPASTGSLVADTFCEIPGKASYSPRMPMMGFPDPQLATKAVGIWPTPVSMLKPAPSSSSESHWAAENSCSPSSGLSQIALAIPPSRSSFACRYSNAIASKLIFLPFWDDWAASEVFLLHKEAAYEMGILP